MNRILWFGVATLLAACASPTSGTSPAVSVPERASVYPATGASGSLVSLHLPALVTVNTGTDAMKFWPLSPSGGKNPQTFARLKAFNGANAIAANGKQLYIVNGSSLITSYNVGTGAESTLTDPLGTPLDIGIGTDGSLYVANDAKPPNVAMYPQAAAPPVELTCNLMSFIDGVAVDVQGNVLISGFGAPGIADGIFEIPTSSTGPQSQNCARLSLKGDAPTGFVVDPKTDDLIVLDNPSQCAGGEEGRMTIYSPPYTKATGVSHVLGGNCPGGLVLSADSSIVLYGDTDVSSSYTFIRQASYPDGKRLGTYWDAKSGAFITIPNRLPN